MEVVKRVEDEEGNVDTDGEEEEDFEEEEGPEEIMEEEVEDGSENNKSEDESDSEDDEDGASQDQKESPIITRLAGQFSQQKLAPSGDTESSTIIIQKDTESASTEERSDGRSTAEAEQLRRKTRKPDKLEQLKDKVTAEVTKERARQKYKYNSKRSTRKVGRPQGSKLKQDARVKIDANTGWD